MRLLLLLPMIAWAQDPAIERLEREMARIAKVAGGVAGATAISNRAAAPH